MAASSPSTQPPPFSTTALPDAAEKDEVESPSVSAPHALARFEFESGRGNEGTKILMVEWDDDEQTDSASGEWHISWEGMRTVLPVSEKEAGKSSELQSGIDGPAKDGGAASGETHRMYFMILPNVAVPPLVTLLYRPRDGAKEVAWQTNPLPAIFPPELGASARTAGKKGVLHTIWAKQRLRALEKEVDLEAKQNTESIGLQMVMSEKAWIEDNFGVQARTPSVQNSDVAAPRSPGGGGGGRLHEKLKGLRLGTSDQALSVRSQSSSESGGDANSQNPLSPETSDVAVSSFSAIKGARRTQPSSLAGQAAKPAQKPAECQPAPVPGRRITVQAPPAFVVNEQQQMSSRSAFGGMTSLMSGGLAAASDDYDEDLFAMPISPRSPEMTTSPFTFAGADTLRYLQGVRGKAA